MYLYWKSNTDTRPEILADNDDASPVELKGNRQKEPKGAYGPSMYIPGSISTIRYTTEVPRSASYRIYTYVPKRTNLPSITNTRVSTDGKTIKQLAYTPASIKIAGQTAGEWVDLGTIHLIKGNKAYVEIINEGKKG